MDWIWVVAVAWSGASAVVGVALGTMVRTADRREAGRWSAPATWSTRREPVCPTRLRVPTARHVGAATRDRARRRTDPVPPRDVPSAAQRATVPLLSWD